MQPLQLIHILKALSYNTYFISSNLKFLHMKKSFLSSIIGLMFITVTFSQTWIPQTSGTVNDVWGVSFVDPLNGWASGSSGTLLHTTDGGTNWSAQNSGVTIPILRNICMYNLMSGWAVGDNGTILNTTNGGTNWNPQTSGSAQTLRQATFVSSSMGWVCGGNGTILKTTDGGANWTPQTSGTTIGLMSIHFVDPNNGWAAGSSGAVTQGIILHTTDGGTNWNPQTTPNNSNLNAISFSSSLNGWAAGNAGTIFSTTNGGSTWGLQTNPSANTIRGMHCVNATDGFAVGDAGSIVNTTDGGANWGTQTSGTAVILRGTNFVNANRGYAVGTAGTILFYNVPIITATGTLTTFNTIQGTPSGFQTFTVSGINLTANLDINAPADFEVSLSSGSGYGSSVSIPPNNTIVTSTTVYVRYNPAVAGTHSGNISCTTTGGSTQYLPVDGVSTFAGINENGNELMFNMFPNPATDYVQIQSNNNSIIDQLQLCDLSGKVILLQKDLGVSKLIISLISIPKGIYLLTVNTNTGIHTKKLIVK